jgi:hypothetical protein
MLKEVMNDLWLARISSLSNEVGLYVILLEVLLFMPNSLINFKIIMDAVEDYTRRWIKREVDQDPELESLSDWVRTIRSLVQGRIHKLTTRVNSFTIFLLSLFYCRQNLCQVNRQFFRRTS